MEQSPLQPTPVGAIRFNTDSVKLEYYDGNQWVCVTSTSPEVQTGGTRAVLGGGSASNVIQYKSMDTTGNTVDFGDLTQNTYLSSACSSRTRGVWNGGYTNSPSSTYINTIQYVTIAQTGNALDFGDLSQLSGYNGSCSNQIRGIRAGGTAPAPAANQDTIEYYTIAQTGNAVDFGNLSVGGAYNSDGIVNSPVRGIWNAGGPSYNNVLEYITISTLGNSADFGDLQYSCTDSCGVCNAVRGLFGGGYLAPTGERNDINYISIASLGNATDFGDMTISSRRYGACSSPTRGLWAGGHTPSAVDVIDFVQIMSTGNALDFGNLLGANYELSGLSNGHGGLG